MSLWSLTKPPIFHSDAVATPSGWVNPVTGEILVAIGNLASREGTSTLESCTLVNPSKTLYKVGDVFELDFQYTKKVVVTGTPRITFAIGVTNLSASYVSGSGTNKLHFQYTIASGNTCSAGGLVVVSPAQLNGGTIKDADDSSHNSPLAFTLPHTAAISVDGVVPAVSNAALNAATYVLAAPINLTLTFNRAVTVTGAPTVALVINGVTRQAAYLSGSGTTSLVFRYTVVGADAATAGQFTTAAIIVLNGGTIVDTLGHSGNATLSFSAPSTGSVVVDGLVAAISSAAVTGTTFVTDNNIPVTLTFNKAVSVTGVPSVPLNIHGTVRQATYASGSGTTALVFGYTVVGGDSAIAGQFVLVSPALLNGGTIVDTNGHNGAATLTFTPPSTATVTVN